MNWFYAQDGKQIGPVDEGELDGLVRRGQILAATLVWRSGLEDWRPYAEVRPPSGPLPLAQAPQPPPLAGEGEQRRCAECGGSFPADEVVRLAGLDICAGCKSIFLQKLREGEPREDRLPFAGFWIRAAAFVFDGLILLPPTFLIWELVFFYDPLIFIENGGLNFRRFVLQLGLLLISVAYETVFVGRFGATPGKMICDLQVVQPDGSRLTYVRAFGRFFAKWLSGIIFGIGYLMAAFDGEKRALHDQICDSRVIQKR